MMKIIYEEKYEQICRNKREGYLKKKNASKKIMATSLIAYL